ncbi:EamA-like transporter family protein [Shimia gijangensis]|uniref:EamA-like transporter family protein n=1 Tax=Shimia gijangensis TaxID=1470563 RepID=A0A1M6PGX3_9RHOB|nr:DMT family transporter [Shimia gijangensis]SHK07137.1 EamA-like transporter family protein [Shimia gijangensis]
MTASVNNRPMVAAVSMMSAMATVGFIDNFVSVIAEEISLWQFQVMRSTFMAPLLVGMAAIGLGRLRPIRWLPVLARATMITVAMMLYFASLGFMPISQALAGLFTSPIWVLLIKTIGLKQRIGPRRIGAVLIGFLGILLVLQPGSDGFGPLMMMPVAAGFFYAISSIATRSWCEGESAVSMLAANMMMLGLAGLVVSFLVGPVIPEGVEFVNRVWTWDIAAVLPWVVLQAVGSLGAVFLIIRAYQMDEPTNVAVFEYTAMLFAPLFAWILFGQTLSFLQGLGIGMIAASGVVIAVRSK